MTTDQKGWLAELMNRLEMVRWDRLTEHDGTVNVYGWIDRAGIVRDDSRRDFIVMTAWPGEHNCTFVTSSAEQSARITELIYGTGAGHVDCKRVEHELQGLVSSVIHL